MLLAQPQIVQRHLDCFPKRTPRWNEFPPLTREKGVKDIGDSVQCEEPHEEKVVAQTFRKLEFEVETVVEPCRKEPEECQATEPDAIDPVCIQPLVLRIGPINESTPVDHHGKQWKRTPQKRDDRER